MVSQKKKKNLVNCAENRIRILLLPISRKSEQPTCSICINSYDSLHASVHTNHIYRLHRDHEFFSLIMDEVE